MSAPRPSRRGNKVEPSPNTSTPTLTASSSTPPTIAASPLKLPDAPGDSPSPASPNNSSQADTPSFLAGQGSLLQFNADASSHVAVGVVRGRGASQPVQERAIEADPSEVKGRVAAAFKKVKETGISETPSPQPLAFKKNDVLLVNEAFILGQTLALAKTDEKAKILFVTPRSADADTYATVESVKAALGEAATATWFGNASTIASTTRFCVTDLSTAQIHLHTTTSFAPFNYVVLSKTDSAAIMYQGLFAQIKAYVVNASASKRPKFAISVNSNKQMEAIGDYFEPLAVNVVPNVIAKFDVLALNADESAAYGGLASVRPPARPMDDRNSQGPPLPHFKVQDRLQQQALGIIRNLVAAASEADAPLSIFVFAGDASALSGSLQAELADKLSIFNSVEDRLAATADELSKKFDVTLMGHAPVAHSTATLPVNVVIDLGTDKGLIIASKAEQLLPTRRVEWASAEECGRRRQCLGVRGVGVYFNLLLEEDAKTQPPYLADPVITSSPDMTILQLARLGVDPIAVLQSAFSKPTVESFEAALTHLSEKSAIASPTEPLITFLGEILSRTGLPTDVSSFLASGVVCGLHELFAITAAIIVSPLRPRTPRTNVNEWLKSATEAMKKFSDIARNSDTISDLAMYLQWSIKGEDDAFAAANLVAAERLKLVKAIQAEILCRLNDFIIPAAPKTSQELYSQLESNASQVEFFLSAALAGGAVTVRAEGAMAGRAATGSLLFLRSSKEVQPNGFAPTTIGWKNNTVVVPVSLNNTTTKIYATGGSLVHQSFFFTSLILMAPEVQYSAPMTHKEEDVICFSVSVNRQIKRFYTDLSTAARILDFREKWNALFGCIQVKRSLPLKASRLQVLSALQAKDKQFDLDEARADALKEFGSLVQQCDMKEYQSVFDSHGVHRTKPATSVTIAEVATASDIAVSMDIATSGVPVASPLTPVDPKHTTQPPTPNVTEPAEEFQRAVFMEDEDDIEVEGQGFLAAGPIVEEE